MDKIFVFQEQKGKIIYLPSEAYQPKDAKDA